MNTQWNVSIVFMVVILTVCLFISHKANAASPTQTQLFKNSLGKTVVEYYSYDAVSADQSPPTQWALGGSSPCTIFKGSCTGTGSGPRCVTAPARIEPDAETVEQCCGSAFQYPWVEVCPGRSQPSMGCSTCLW